MTRDNDQETDILLDTLFEAGKAHPPAPNAAFLARLSEDMESAVPRLEIRPTILHQPSVFERFKSVFAASGLTSAAALGLWIGFVAPDVLTTVSPLTEDVAALSAFLPGSDLSVLSE